jgi:hypothetical protein
MEMHRMKIVIWLMVLVLSGCNHLRTFPLYSEVYVEHPDFIKLSYYEPSGYTDAIPETREAYERIEDYLSKNLDVPFSIRAALRAFRVEKGMNEEQVRLIIGEPRRKKILKDGSELWIYDKKDYRHLLAINFLSRLKFKNGTLIDYDRNKIFDRASIYLIRKRMEVYFEENPNLNQEIKTALSELKIQKGMDKEQVLLVVGEPTTKKKLRDNNELWIYKGDRMSKGERQWYYGWGKLKFHNGILKDIEVQYINIYK